MMQREHGLFMLGCGETLLKQNVEPKILGLCKLVVGGIGKGPLWGDLRLIQEWVIVKKHGNKPMVCSAKSAGLVGGTLVGGTQRWTTCFFFTDETAHSYSFLFSTKSHFLNFEVRGIACVASGVPSCLMNWMGSRGYVGIVPPTAAGTLLWS